MALSLDILANTRQAQSNVKDLGKALEDVDDSFTDIAKGGEKSGDKLERTFKDMARDAEKAEKAVDKVGDSARKSGDKASRGMQDAGAATGEFKDEALSNFSEVTSSFDGSMESIGELAQGTLGGVAATIPGIGLAAGVAAAGIGGITSRLTEIGDRSKEITDGIVADFIEMGDALDAEAVNSRVSEILKVESTRKEAELLAELLGTTVGQAALAMAGDFEAAGVTVDEVMQGIADAPGDVNYDTWVNLKNTVESTGKALEYGQEAANAASDAMDRKARSDLNAAMAAGEVVEEVDELGNSLYTLPDGKQILINADTRKATTDVSAFKGDLDGIPDKTVRIRAIVDKSDWDNWTPAQKRGTVRALKLDEWQ